MHLPPSRHQYPYWNYKRDSTAERIHVDEDDKVFQEMIKRMSPYLRKEPTEENVLTLDSFPSHTGGSNISDLEKPWIQHGRHTVKFYYII